VVVRTDPTLYGDDLVTIDDAYFWNIRTASAHDCLIVLEFNSKLVVLDWRGRNDGHGLYRRNSQKPFLLPEQWHFLMAIVLVILAFGIIFLLICAFDWYHGWKSKRELFISRIIFLI